MIVGVVRGRAPRVTLTVHGTGGRQESVEFIVDTGFTGDRTLPPSVLQEIAATVRGRGFMLLADGTERTCARFAQSK